MSVSEITTKEKPINAGEAAQITATLYDQAEEALDKASIKTLTLTLTDLTTEAIINSRDADDIYDTGGGILAADGTLTLNLTSLDNPILGSTTPEFHKYHLEWTWDDLQAAEQIGIDEDY